MHIEENRYHGLDPIDHHGWADPPAAAWGTMFTDPDGPTILEALTEARNLIMEQTLSAHGLDDENQEEILKNIHSLWNQDLPAILSTITYTIEETVQAIADTDEITSTIAASITAHMSPTLALHLTTAINESRSAKPTTMPAATAAGVEGDILINLAATVARTVTPPIARTLAAAFTKSLQSIIPRRTAIELADELGSTAAQDISPRIIEHLATDIIQTIEEAARDSQEHNIPPENLVEYIAERTRNRAEAIRDHNNEVFINRPPNQDTQQLGELPTNLLDFLDTDEE